MMGVLLKRLRERILSKIQMINADCMDYMKTCKDNEFDLAIVDPPYGININSSGRLGHYGGKGKKWDKNIPTDKYFNELSRVSKNQIVWGANYFKLGACKCFLIWDKQQPEDVSFASCEFAWTSFDSSAKTYYQRPQNMDEQRIHPTQKPIKLYQWLLDRYAKPTDRILDTHLGSASSAIAAHYFGCDFVGIELDKDYFKTSQERFNNATKQNDFGF
jgi:site-specific DNA-methyltransferase (adenine-specific)